MISTIKKLASWVFVILCILIGLYPAVYIFADPTFGLLASKSTELLSSIVWNIGFYGHISFGGLALAIGWIQFNKQLRNRNLSFHRTIGKIYVISVLISGTCGVYIGFFATGGLISKLGFILLGITWLSTMISGYMCARNGNIDKHRVMMIYSYAACFAAVTLRIWLPLLIANIGDFIPAYQIVAWLCWVPNIIVAYFIVRYTSPKINVT